MLSITAHTIPSAWNPRLSLPHRPNSSVHSSGLRISIAFSTMHFLTPCTQGSCVYSLIRPSPLPSRHIVQLVGKTNKQTKNLCYFIVDFCFPHWHVSCITRCLVHRSIPSTLHVIGARGYLPIAWIQFKRLLLRFIRTRKTFCCPPSPPTSCKAGCCVLSVVSVGSQSCSPPCLVNDLLTVLLIKPVSFISPSQCLT